MLSFGTCLLTLFTICSGLYVAKEQPNKTEISKTLYVTENNSQEKYYAPIYVDSSSTFKTPTKPTVKNIGIQYPN